MTKIKICGLSRFQDIEAVNEAQPDFAGFVIEVPGSSRNVTENQARRLVQRLSARVQAVGVFVNAPAEQVAELLEEGTLAMAQLHGQEDEAYIRKLRKRTGKPLIQAFSVRSAEDVKRAFRSTADYLLLDQGRGGTGKAFDWSLLGTEALREEAVWEIDPDTKNRIWRRPFFLAGGLGEHNLLQAVSQVGPWAVDLSSSLETDGRKDARKIKRAVELVRAG